MEQRYFFLSILLLLLDTAYAQVAAVIDYAYNASGYTTNQFVTNVLDNDHIDNLPATSANVILTPLTTNPFFTLLSDGSVLALQSVFPDQEAIIQYQICDIANPNRCDDGYLRINIFPNSEPLVPPTVTTIVATTCANPFASIKFDDFPIDQNLGFAYWWVSIYSNGTFLEGQWVPSSGIVIFENVSPGEIWFSIKDLDEISNYQFGYYVPEPVCDFNFNFIGTLTDANANGITDVGDTIIYSFNVNNNETLPVANVTIDSATLNITGGPIASLPIGATDSTTFTAVYPITQQDINNNRIDHLGYAYASDGSQILADSYQSTLFLNAPDGIRMAMFLDYNNNGVMDANETYSPYVSIGDFSYEINNDGLINHVGSSDSTFTLYESNPANGYHLEFVPNPNYATTYQSSTIFDVSVATGSGIVTYLFPVTRIPLTDFYVLLSSPPKIRPGFGTSHTIYYSNFGNTPISSGILSYVKNPQLNIANVSQPVNNTANGFDLNFSNLQAGEMRMITVTLQAPNIPVINIGDQLASMVVATVDSNNETVLANNQSVLSQTVNNSYDPNSISENHGPQIEFNDFTEDDFLTYTIRFENAGNADAINVVLTDLLDDKLDATTVRTIYATHDYVSERVGQNLQWTFGNVQLAPSVDDSDVGKGHVIFEVKPKPGFAVGDIIPNSANIYFDFNPAIWTNTFETEFVNTLSVAGFEESALRYYPNPVNNYLSINLEGPNIETVWVSDLLGKTLLTQKVNANQATLDLAHLLKGMYFIRLQTESGNKTVKISKQ